MGNKKKDNIYNIFFVIGILLFLVCSSIFFHGFFGCKSGLLCSVKATNVSLILLAIGAGLILCGISSRWLFERRTIDSQEVQSLFAEVETFKNGKEDKNLTVAIEEMARIKDIGKGIVELEAVPLRKALVGLYPVEELVSKADYELKLLEEYTPENPSYDDLYEEWKEKIRDSQRGIKEAADNAENRSRHEKKLRADLKTLRETVAWYDKTWAEGEKYIKGVCYWAAFSALIFAIIGILPIIHPHGSGAINILQWMALGFCGALLSILISIGELDVNEVGEQEGKQLFVRTVGRVAIGSITAILLYVALSGGILAGKVFPKLPIKNVDVEVLKYWANTGLSVFWGIFSGFSFGILAKLSGIANGAFGNDTTNDSN